VIIALSAEVILLYVSLQQNTGEYKKDITGWNHSQKTVKVDLLL
jgi:hypothetical protein